MLVPLICVIEALIGSQYPKELISLLTELVDDRDFEIVTKADMEYIANLNIKTHSGKYATRYPGLCSPNSSKLSE